MIYLNLKILRDFAKTSNILEDFLKWINLKGVLAPTVDKENIENGNLIDLSYFR